MSAPRLELALSGGGLDLSGTGRIAVFAPRAGMDLSVLPRDRVLVVSGFRPDVEGFEAAGYATSVAAEGRFDAAIVFLPRAKRLAEALVAQAVAVSDGPVVVDGARTDGIEGVLKAVRKRVAVEGPINKAHGKLFWFSGGDFTDWAAAEPAPLEGGWITAPGVFSADGIDPASALLAAALPAKLSGKIADLGAGWGYLASEVLKRDGVKSIDLVEADHAALDCARRNVTDPRARFHWADATRWRPETLMDAVVMNPPFHTSRTADPGIGQAFIRAAAGMLRPGGRVWIVANRHLPYETVIAGTFGAVEEIGGDTRFKVMTATLAPRNARHNRVS
ncbi:MFS transporter [Oceanicola sp. 22II-s10i]|uniref:methyltransferase n=1 Tax=Oceanicola sp. 22II-s10i TaxID=1317116 RepID=UPI000B52256F|nr:methyltransferase [Oceanicola sp. 22II-s10i]OWU85542.1 MFS transporter [Oceanicola sp. 22II-s10i]